MLTWQRLGLACFTSDLRQIICLSSLPSVCMVHAHRPVQGLSSCAYVSSLTEQQVMNG